jgi:hypothetical protein
MVVVPWPHTISRAGEWFTMVWGLRPELLIVLDLAFSVQCGRSTHHLSKRPDSKPPNPYRMSLTVKRKSKKMVAEKSEGWRKDFDDASSITYELHAQLPESRVDVTAILLDMSASMEGPRARQLAQLVTTAALALPPEVLASHKVSAFGQKAEKDDRFVDVSLMQALGRMKFNSSTDATAIGGAIKRSSLLGDVSLVVLGDGSFDRGAEGFADMLEMVDLGRVRSVVLLFPYDTTAYVVDSLKRALGKVIEQAPHPIKFRVVPPIPLDNEAALLTQLQQEYDALHSQVPAGCQGFGGLAWSKDMPNDELAARIRGLGGAAVAGADVAAVDGAAVCRRWCQEFRATVEHCPSVLLVPGNPYAAVYDVIKRLRGGRLVPEEDEFSPERLVAWVSTLRGLGPGAPGAGVADALSAVIQGSQGENQKLLRQLYALSPQTYKCAPVQQAQAQEAVRDQSGRAMKELLQGMLTSAEFSGFRGMPATTAQFSGTRGMPIPSKSRCAVVGKPYAQACWEACRFLLAAADVKAVLDGSSLFTAVLLLLCDDALVLPSVVRGMCEAALMGNPEWVLKSLGVNAAGTELDDLPKWSAALLSCLVYKACRMYPGVFSSVLGGSVVSFFEQRYRLILKLGAYARIRASEALAVTRTLTSTGLKGDCTLLGVGDLCALKGLKGFKQPLTVAVFLGLARRGGHKYLHFKHFKPAPGCGDTVRVRHRADVQLLVRAPGIAPQELAQYAKDAARRARLERFAARVPTYPLASCSEYKACVSRMSAHVKPTAGASQSDHAEFCKGAGACATQAELDAYLGMKTETQTITVPEAVVKQVVLSADCQLKAAVEAKGGFMEQLQAGLDASAAGASGAAGVGSGARAPAGAFAFKHGEVVVSLSVEEQGRVVDYYKTLCAPAAVETKGGSVTARVCVACLEPRRPQDCEAMCAKGGKSHFACKECLARVTPCGLPKAGEVVSLVPYRCFVCREFRPQLPAHIRPLAAGGEQHYRVCARLDCGRIFAYHPQCGGDEDDTLCVEHAAVIVKPAEDPKVFDCPRCHMQLQHAGGCRLMRCCPKGYHGCGLDRGEACAHRVCACASASACGHDQGCGHTFFIDEQSAVQEDEEQQDVDYFSDY